MPILSALKLGDVSMNAARGPGRMLQAVGALALVGPWAITANLVIGMSRREKVVALSILGAHSAIAAGLLVWASRRARNKALDFWIATGMFAITLLVVVAFAASRIDHFEVMPLVDARALLRLVTVHFAAINIASLRPEKAWYVAKAETWRVVWSSRQLPARKGCSACSAHALLNYTSALLFHPQGAHHCDNHPCHRRPPCDGAFVCELVGQQTGGWRLTRQGCCRRGRSRPPLLPALLSGH